VIASLPEPLAVNATDAELLPGVTLTSVGASGAVAAVNDPEATEAGLVPKSFVTVAVQV
jgi:hypothetical protein